MCVHISTSPRYIMRNHSHIMTIAIIYLFVDQTVYIFCQQYWLIYGNHQLLYARYQDQTNTPIAKSLHKCHVTIKQLIKSFKFQTHKTVWHSTQCIKVLVYIVCPDQIIVQLIIATGCGQKSISICDKHVEYIHHLHRMKKK